MSHAVAGDGGHEMLADWPRAWGAPAAAGRLRQRLEDFVVDEILPWAPAGQGDHLWLWVEKRGLNTDQVARRLARWAGVRPVDVGYAGLKDRQGITRQWFSVNLAGRAEPDPAALESEALRVVEAVRHGRKLKRGALAGNRFSITIRDLAGDWDAVIQRLHQIRGAGMPNYFGEQRFGRDGGNIAKALALFAGTRVRDRHKRGLYLSAARAALFNHVLAQRVSDGTWNQALAGDVFMLEGSHSHFPCAKPDEEIGRRLQAMDIHPTGPLWGRGAPASEGVVRQLEQAVAERYGALAGGLVDAGLDVARRALRARVSDLSWSAEGSALTLAFALPAGSYATALIRELITQVTMPAPRDAVAAGSSS